MRHDFIQLFSDHQIPFAKEGNKHCRPGWVQVRDCSFCGDEKYHLGININGEYAHCWKCGHHGFEETIAGLLNVPNHKAWIELKKYKLRPSLAMLERNEKFNFVRPQELKLPIGCGPLQDMHRDYLIERDYDPDRLEHTFKLMGTGPAGPYKFRIIAPVFFNDKMVSFQGRDITGQSSLPKKSCKKENELRDHKHCLYAQELVLGDAIAITEGPPNAWRLGPGAVATFGTAYMMQQVLLMKSYKRRFIILDSEEKDPNAPEQADQLANYLSAFPGETIIVDLDSGDPGDLPQDEADYLMEKEWKIR